MAKRHYYLDTRILSIFFIVAMPFVAIGAVLVVSMASSALREHVGASLEQQALQTRVLVERYVGDQFVMLRLIARYPEVAQALARAGTAGAGAGGDAERQARAWAEADPALVQAVTGSALAARLRDVIGVRPAVRLLQVVDARGRLVAASARGGRFSSRESPFFAALTQEPVVERPWVGDFHRPQGSSLVVLEVAWPVLSAEGALLGAVRALIDGADVYGVIAPVRVGRTGHAELVRASDGLLLASDQPRVLTSQLPGFAALQAAMSARRGYTTVPAVTAAGAAGQDAVAEPARILAVSRVEQVPGVQWLATVEQDLDEALAPVDRTRFYLWVHFAGAFGTAILLGLYYSIKLEQPVLDDEVPIVEELEGRHKDDDGRAAA